MGIFDVLGKAAGVVGKGFEGYGVDKQLRVKNVLAEQEAGRNAANDKVMNALRVSQTGENDARAYDLANPTPRVQIAPDGTAILPVGYRIRRNPDGTVSAVKDDPTPSVAPVATPAVPPLGGAEPPPVGPTAQAPAAPPPASRVGPSSVASVVRQGSAGTPAPVGEKPINFAKPAIERAKAYANYVDPTDNTKVKLLTGDEASRLGWIKQTSTSTGMNTRGFGQGGVFGAGSGVGSVNEMTSANPNLKTYEKTFLGDVPTGSLTAIDRFRQRIADDLKVNGFISAAKATEAERELAAYNPDLVVYGRNLAQWIISDLNLSRGATDERQRLDFHVSGLGTPMSSMPKQQRETFINQMWEARDGRLAGLQQASKAATKMLEKIHGQGGGAAGGTAKPSISQAEAAALKAQGFTDAQIGAKYTVTP